MDKIAIDILKTLAENAPKWLQGLGAIAVAKGITGIYQAQYGKIKSLIKTIKDINSIANDNITNEDKIQKIKKLCKEVI